MTTREVNIELDRLLSFLCVMLLSDVPHSPAAFERFIFKSAVILPLPPSASPFLWQSQLKPEAYAASLSPSSLTLHPPRPHSLNPSGSLFSLFVEAEVSVHSSMTGSMHVGDQKRERKALISFWSWKMTQASVLPVSSLFLASKHTLSSSWQIVFVCTLTATWSLQRGNTWST